LGAYCSRGEYIREGSSPDGGVGKRMLSVGSASPVTPL